MAKLVVTSRDLTTLKKTRSALRRAIPGASIRGVGLRAIVLVEAEGSALELAEKVNRECWSSIGRAVAVLSEVESSFNPVKEAAVKAGMEYIGQEESFCFRLHKRGSHGLVEDTPKLEYEIGGDIWEVLEKKYGKKPKVDLRNPDVAVIAEVLGPQTAVGVLRKNWRHGHPEEPD